ncbi:hypothetical protein RJ639_031308 [Escallonia herrerae]|uniref:Uncharacterized protein n=1 Tax=Escallonia herrerae TaxID=1293975 RepID=A0AA88XE89_9ASTE|nr:hypothetical protein RJ639_031308 [Escallonia herrerae]
MAGMTYIELLTPKLVEQSIEKERHYAFFLPAIGGQISVNLALGGSGAPEKYGTWNLNTCITSATDFEFEIPQLAFEKFQVSEPVSTYPDKDPGHKTIMMNPYPEAYTECDASDRYTLSNPLKLALSIQQYLDEHKPKCDSGDLHHNVVFGMAPIEHARTHSEYSACMVPTKAISDSYTDTIWSRTTKLAKRLHQQRLDIVPTIHNCLTFLALGFRIVSTSATEYVLELDGIPVERVQNMHEGQPHTGDMIATLNP